MNYLNGVKECGQQIITWYSHQDGFAFWYKDRIETLHCKRNVNMELRQTIHRGNRCMKQNTIINLLRSYLIKGLAIPLVGIKYPSISTNLLKHSNRRKGE
jgi:hypothetical protein